MKIGILSRMPRCYSTRRLKEAAADRGHKVQVLDTLRFSMMLEQGDPDLYYRHRRLGNLDAIIPWILLDLLYAAQIHWMLVRIGNFGVLTAILFQIPLCFFVLVFALSLFKTFILKKSRWKGRMVNTEEAGKKDPCD